MKKTTNGSQCPRLGKVGGQAVLEGVMMKAGDRTVTTCRKDDGSLTVVESTFVSVRKKHKLLDLPLLRGVVNFVEMMKLSMKTLEISAEALEIEEEDGKVEQWLKKHLGINLTGLIMAVGTVLGVALALVLFMFLPSLIADLCAPLFRGGAFAKSLTEGVAKVIIFLSYLALISLLPDIRRVFMYHGAEHKSIACFESGTPLTPENAKEHTRFHPRCGTSFMFFMILIGIVAGLFVRLILPDLPTILYVLIRLSILPLVVGIGYEFIMYAGRHDNLFTRTLSAPGLWVQRITTKEPTLPMLECAITSLKIAMREDCPEFMEFYLQRAWEPPTATCDTTTDTTDDTVTEERPTDAIDDTVTEECPTDAIDDAVVEERPTDAIDDAATEERPTDAIDDAVTEECPTDEEDEENKTA